MLGRLLLDWRQMGVVWLREGGCDLKRRIWGLEGRECIGPRDRGNSNSDSWLAMIEIRSRRLKKRRCWYHLIGSCG